MRLVVRYNGKSSVFACERDAVVAYRICRELAMRGPPKDSKLEIYSVENGKRELISSLRYAWDSLHYPNTKQCISWWIHRPTVRFVDKDCRCASSVSSTRPTST